MFGIIYNAVYYAVFYAAWSLAGGVLPMFFFFLLSMYLQRANSSAIVLSVLVIFLLIATVLFVHSTSRRMVNPQSMKFLPDMKPKKLHADFLIFTCSDIFLTGGAAYLCARTAKSLYVYSRQVELEHANMFINTIRSGGNTDLSYDWNNGVILASYGSMTLAVVMLFLLLYFWRRFFRLALKISAFTAGYNLSGKEAIDLTEACRWEIFLISVLVNGGLLAFFPAVLFDGDGWRAGGSGDGGILGFYTRQHRPRHIFLSGIHIRLHHVSAQEL